MTEQERKKYAVPLMKSHSEAFKRKVVMEVENGLLSKDGVKYRYCWELVGVGMVSQIW